MDMWPHGRIAHDCATRLAPSPPAVPFPNHHPPASPRLTPQDFEKKEPRVKARAATNLAFLYFLEGETDQADKYSEMALKSDRYNARAYVNKGCVLVERGDLEGARSLFNEVRTEEGLSRAVTNRVEA